MNKASTLIFLEEIKTDGHSPMKFICSDGQIYYCKYRVNSKLEELDCLVYEMVCSFLANYLEIPTPEIAIVELLSDSFLVRDIPKNKRYAKAGILCFGSKELENSNLVTGLELVNSEDNLAKIYNPYDLIKIAFFDLWIDNDDRGKNQNYNLLTTGYDNKLKIWAFDHAFAFGGQNNLRIFSSTRLPHTHNKLVETDYFKGIVKQLDRNQCLEIIKKLTESLGDAVEYMNQKYQEIPTEWIVFDRLKTKINDFLLEPNRIKEVQSLLFKIILTL